LGVGTNEGTSDGFRVVVTDGNLLGLIDNSIDEGFAVVLADEVGGLLKGFFDGIILEVIPLVG
jgi:hypothetical protein